MYHLTKIHGARPEARLSGLPNSPEKYPPTRLAQVARALVQGAWRRRRLIMLPVLMMLIVSLAAAIALPRVYTTRSLLELQETSRENPFSQRPDFASNNRERSYVQERFAALQALFTSERVLSRMFNGVGESLTPAEREVKIAELRNALSFSLIGGDFIMVELTGSEAKGLSKKLEKLIAGFLEALIPEDSTTATRMITNVRRQDLEAIMRNTAEIDRELRTLLHGGPSEAARRLAAIEERRRDRTDALAQIEAEVSRVISVLGNPREEQLRQETVTYPTRPHEVEPGHHQVLPALQSLTDRRQSIVAEIRDLDADAATLNKQVKRYWELQKRLDELKQEIVAAQNAYETNLRRKLGAASVQTVGILKAPELIRIVDPPRDPTRANHSRLLYIISGVAAGGLLGIAHAIMAEKLDQRVRHAEEACEAAGIPVLAVIHQSDHAFRESGKSDRSGGGDGPPRLAAARG